MLSPLKNPIDSASFRWENTIHNMYTDGMQLYASVVKFKSFFIDIYRGEMYMSTKTKSKQLVLHRKLSKADQVRLTLQNDPKLRKELNEAKKSKSLTKEEFFKSL
jgi:hypothetical protein